MWIKRGQRHVYEPDALGVCICGKPLSQFTGVGGKRSRRRKHCSEECKDYAWRTRPDNRAAMLAQHKQARRDNPARAMLNRAKQNAKRRGIEFTIAETDIPSIPSHCPVFPWIEIVYRVGHSSKGGPKPNDAPSLDRINNNLGYVPGNLRIISHRANSAKSDLTDIELYCLGQDALARMILLGTQPFDELDTEIEYGAKKNFGVDAK